MKKLLLVILFLSILISEGISQSIILGNTQKKVTRTAAGTTQTVTIGVSVINCTPGRIVHVEMFNNNSGTADINSYTIPSISLPTVGTPNGSIQLEITNPTPLPQNDETIPLRFVFHYDDTVVVNHDTITIIGNRPAPSPVTPAFSPIATSRPKWFKDTTNIFRIELNQYTDFLGFDNQKPNGLVQQQLIVKFPLPFHKTGDSEKSIFYFQPLRSIVFNALLNRIDKAGNLQAYPAASSLPTKTTNFNPDSIRPYLTTLDIFKYSNLQAGLKFNILTFHILNFRLNFDYEFGVLRNKPYYSDTIKVNNITYTKSDVRPVYSFIHKIEIFGNSAGFIGDRNRVAVNAGLMWINLKDSYYKQFDAAIVDPFDKASALLPASDARNGRNATPIWFFSGTWSVFYGDKKKNSTFFRINYYHQTGSYNRYGGSSNLTDFDPKRFYVDRFHNHFLQIQAGATLDLDAFLGIKDDKKAN